MVGCLFGHFSAGRTPLSVFCSCPWEKGFYIFIHACHIETLHSAVNNILALKYEKIVALIIFIRDWCISSVV